MWNNYWCYKIIHFYQYCDSNIGLFSMAPCKVFTLNLICFILNTRILLLFSIALSQLTSYRSSKLVDLKGYTYIGISYPFLFDIAIQNKKESYYLYHNIETIKKNLVNQNPFVFWVHQYYFRFDAQINVNNAMYFANLGI